MQSPVNYVTRFWILDSRMRSTLHLQINMAVYSQFACIFVIARAELRPPALHSIKLPLSIGQCTSASS